MKARNLLLIIGIGLILSCQNEKQTDNPEVLEKVLISYFDGIKDKDLDKMNASTTNDFVLFENGKIWNNDSLFNFLNALPPYSATFTLSPLKTSIDEEIGNLYYLNHMDMTLNDTIEDKYDWIESATFKKVEGEWKLDFLHSTVKE
ncbi:nuclear transport factor 2 family protein [Carboxylicivirga caseinilyticus]|uniref:nuclear transport factor 2 family protein n=1 Tax=Carboxylicivirga caseinilyticus TaxID=3417572 RepID=UPI003D352AB4|nr:nuclear transport factor 2 family protein [Marinilabiliaceae bacterium A049]